MITANDKTLKDDNAWEWGLLPHILAEYGENIADINRYSHKMIGTALLATACASIGKNCFITPDKRNQTWKEYCNLWGICAAPAGSRKSEILSKAIAPVIRSQAQLHSEYAEEYQNYKLEESEYKSKKSDYDAKVKMYTLSKKDTSKLSVPNEPMRPVKKYHVATNITAERIPSFIANSEGSALVALDEMSDFFRSTGANSSRGTGQEARTIYLSAWSGNGFDSRLRQDSEKETNTYGASISIFGMVQPDIIADHVINYKKSKDGLLSRFQLTTYEPRYTKFKHSNSFFNQMAQDKYSALILKLLSLRCSTPFCFDDGAQELFYKWLNSNEEKLMKYNDRGDLLMAEIVAKRAKIVSALALVVHIADHISSDIDLSYTISYASLQRAIALNDFYLNESKRIVGAEEDREKAEESLSENILRWLEDPTNKDRLKDGVTASQISMDLRKKGARPSAEQIIQVALDLGFKLAGRRIKGR